MILRYKIKKIISRFRKYLHRHKVIDGDEMTCMEEFDEKQTNKKIEKYKQIGKWEDISVDSEGDIIMWKNKDKND